MSKGTFYANWRFGMNMLYKNSILVLEYPNQIPNIFKELVTTALLKPYAVNRGNSNIYCDLDKHTFGIAMNPAYWKTAWLSLLTYFAKYGEYLWDICDTELGKQANLDQTVRAILDSWSGQVGLYTAFGLWVWANKDEQFIHSSYDQFNGIHNAMNHFTILYAPNKLMNFLEQYNLGLDRCSRLFIKNYEERLILANYNLPAWYRRGEENDRSLSESPEWNDYMGYSDEDYDEDDADYYDYPEDWDFEED